MAKNIIAGNWKMNLNAQQATDLIEEIKQYWVQNKPSSQLILAPSYVFLKEAVEICRDTGIAIAAQNLSEYKAGAYTGEVSAEMLQSMGVKYAIIGHSERREYFGDGDNLKDKLSLCYSHQIIPILCVGEKLEDRHNGAQQEIVKNQLISALENININDGEELIIAYEPVWAIGTGETATSAQAQEMHQFIRNWLKDKFGSEIAADISILYGGSVKPENAAELLEGADVNGGLIGGASLKAGSFCDLVEISEGRLS